MLHEFIHGIMEMIVVQVLDRCQYRTVVDEGVAGMADLVAMNEK